MTPKIQRNTNRWERRKFLDKEFQFVEERHRTEFEKLRRMKSDLLKQGKLVKTLYTQFMYKSQELSDFIKEGK